MKSNFIFAVLTLSILAACSVQRATVKTDPVKPQEQVKLDTLFGSFEGDRMTAFLWPSDLSKLQNATKTVAANSDRVDVLEIQKLKVDQEIFDKTQEKKQIEASACTGMDEASPECQQARFDKTREIAAVIEALQKQSDDLFFVDILGMASEVESVVGVEPDGFKNYLRTESNGNTIVLSPDNVSIDFANFGESQQAYSSSNPQEIDEVSFDATTQVLKFRLLEKNVDGVATGNFYRFDLQEIPFAKVKVRFVGKLFYTAQGASKAREGAAKIDGSFTPQ